MSVPQVAVEQSYNNVQAGIPITVSLQTHSADWITVQFGSQREVAELNIDYEIEYDTNSQFVTITPRQELIDKIDDDGTNIIYVVRGTPLTSDYGETDAFVRRKTSLEVERLTMRDQETTVAVNNRLGLDSLLADWDGRAKVIKNIIDNSDPSSAATRGSLNAYAAMLPPVSLPPYFQNNVQAALSSIATGIFVVMLMAGPATGLPAPTGYVRVDAEPSHLLKFRSTDHYLKDSVTVDNVNGGWWEADPGFHGLDTRAYGAKNDSNHLGTIGTDSTDAIQACINTHFHTIRFPHGWTRFDRKLVPYAGQVWAGVEIRQEDGEQIGGAGLVYGGSLPRSGAAGDNGTGGFGYECAIESDPSIDFTETYWHNLTIVAGSNATCTWIRRTWGASNIYDFKVSMKHGNQCLKTGPAQVITSITRANPGVVNYVGADPAEGQRILISGGQMTEVKNREFFATNVNPGAKTFQLETEDTTAYHTYVSGGTITPADLFYDSYGGDEGGPTGGSPSWGGQGFTWVGGKIIGSCYQNRKRTRTQSNFQFWFARCRYETSADRSRVNPGQDAYLGYGWALDIAGNDIHLNDCHVNNASVMGRLNGGLYITGTNFENVSQGSITSGPDCLRHAIIARNSAGTGGQGGASGIIVRVTGCQINQPSYALEVNASYNIGVADCNVTFTGNTVRRPSGGSVRLIGNSTFKASGGCYTGNVQTDRESGVLCDPVITILQTWRGVAVDHRGFRKIGNAGAVPDHWREELAGAPIRWRPKFNSTVIAEEGLALTVVGTKTARAFAVTDLFTGYSGPSVDIVSGGGTAAAMYATDYCCWRGDDRLRGGIFMKAQFAMSALAGAPHGFFGLSNTAAELANVEPSTLVKCFGIGFDSGQTTFRVLRSGASGPTAFDLGANFPTNVSTNIYQLLIWAAPFSSNMFVRLRCWNTKQEVVFGFNTSIPNPTTPFVPHLWLRDAAGAGGIVEKITFYGMDMRAPDDMIAGDM